MHDGRIARPNGRATVLPLSSGEQRSASSYFKLAEGEWLVVSRGIGVSDLSIRLFSPPEVHLYTIRAASQA